MTTTAADNAAFLSACPHFGQCGGCQPITDKAALLTHALARAGFAPASPVTLRVSAPHTRRRMDLAVRRISPGNVELGLHPRHSHAIIDLDECRVLLPELVALLPGLRTVLGRCDLLRREGSVLANATASGPDLLLRTDAAPSRHDRTRLADFAETAGIARITHALPNGQTEILVGRTLPQLHFGAVRVIPPAGAFLQATGAGEAAIRQAVLAGLPKATNRKPRIAELYAGCGTLTFALAEHAVVDAYEGDTAAHAALDAACRAAMLTGRINPIRRDLARQPLMPDELARLTCLVLDPPAAGASAQMAQIAAALSKQRPGRIIYVSCEPETLARDATTLHRAGYQLLSTTAIDQFIGTSRVESVSTFFF